MIRKVYACLSGKEITFPVRTSRGVTYITFNGPLNQYKTSDKEIQKAIEATERFKNGTIILSRQNGGAEPEEKIETQKEYPGITDFQEAAEILRKDFNVAHQSVRSPEAILKKAQEVGVSFPDLK